MKLGKRAVDAAVPRAARYFVWDADLKGFGLRIEPSGVKTFVVRYRAAGGGRNAPQRQMVIGRFGTLTPEHARRAAEKVLHGVTVGMDPAGELAERRREMLVEALVDLYEAEGCFIQRGIRQGQPMKARTKAYTLARLRHHVVPLLGKRRVSEVGPGDIERFVRDVAAGKSAKAAPKRKKAETPSDGAKLRSRVIVRGGEGAARKVVRDLSAVFSFARRRSIVTANPVDTAAVRKTDNRRDRFLSLDEVRRLGTALTELEAEGVNPKALNITRLWALTGCRRDEIAGLRWGEINFERGLLIFDDTKTGKNVRPLGSAAMALLTTLEGDRDLDTEYVFPATSGDRFFVGTKDLWPRIIERANLPGVTPHVLRHTLGSTATSTGEALALTGAILGHANLRSTAIYAHVARDPAKRAADRVSNKIDLALNGRPSGKVVALRERR